MRYKCLVFDHDDTVVNSTATIHHPCFVDFLQEYYPGRSCTLEEYFLKNFNPGFIEMCRRDYGMTDAQLEAETGYWRRYVESRIPEAYPGIREIMERQRAEGGFICVVSHSFDFNIRRDYAENHLPAPELVYGWEQPEEKRKPKPFPLQAIMEQLDLRADELLMIDDAKPGYDMAKACGVDFAAVGWANDVAPIERFMRANCDRYFKTVEELDRFLRE